MPVKYSEDLLRQAVSSCTNMTEVIRFIDAPQSSGSTHNHLKRRIDQLGIDTTHFRKGKGWRKGLTSPNRKRPEQILRRNKTGSRRADSYQLRRALIESGVPYRCSICRLLTWRGSQLTLQVDHIDGDRDNNEKTNLRFLCPNCHSQTDTYGRTKQLRV